MNNYNLTPAGQQVAGPGTQVAQNSIPSLGSVAQMPAALGQAAFADGIIFELDNSAGVTPAIFLMFDPNRLYEVNSGKTVVAPTGASSSVAGLKSYVAANGIIFQGFNYQVSVSANQFNNRVFKTFGDVDGSFAAKPILPSLAKRNSQFDPLLLTFETPISVDGNRGVEVTVDAGEFVTISFFNGIMYGRQ